MFVFLSSFQSYFLPEHFFTFSYKKFVVSNLQKSNCFRIFSLNVFFTLSLLYFILYYLSISITIFLMLYSSFFFALSLFKTFLCQVSLLILFYLFYCQHFLYFIFIPYSLFTFLHTYIIYSSFFCLLLRF